MIIKEDGKRVYKTPIIVPASVVMVIVIHFGYVLLSASGADQSILTALSDVAFEVLVMCEVGMMTMIFHNKKKVDSFLEKYATIDSRGSLEELKPIIRTNMYSALFTVIFLALGTLTAIMTIVNDTYIMGFVAAALCVGAAKAINWYNPSEQDLKQIKCTDPELENELELIFKCWLHKALPNF